MRTDALHELISTLTQAEKRYVTVAIKKQVSSKESLILQIYKAVEKQEEYDKEKIKKTLSKKISDNAFAVEKNYLYNLIVKVLISFHNATYPLFKIREMLSSVRLLYNRGLTGHAIKQIKKAKKLAIEHEEYEQLLEIYKWEINLEYLQPNRIPEDIKIDEIISDKNEVQNIIDASSKIEKFWAYATRLMEVSPTELPFSAETEKQLKNAYHILDTLPLTTHYKTITYRVLALIYFGSSDHEILRETSLKSLELFEAHPNHKTNNSIEYVRALALYGLCCSGLKLKKEAESVLDKFEITFTTSKNLYEKNLAFEKLFLLAFPLYMRIGEMEKAKYYANHFLYLYGTKKFKLNPLTEAVIKYHCCRIFIFYKDYKKALAIVNELLLYKFKVATDLSGFIKILNILIHFELNNYDLLAYLLNNTRINLKKSNELRPLEDVFLTLIHNLTNAKGASEKKQLFVEFQDYLNLPDTKIFKDYFEYKAWVESHLENKSMLDIFKERNLKKE